VGNRAIRVAIWCVLCCVHGWLNGAFTWLFASKYRTTEPRYLWYCGTKKYRELHGTGTVKKWYCGSTVVPPNTTSDTHTPETSTENRYQKTGTIFEHSIFVPDHPDEYTWINFSILLFSQFVLKQ